MPSLLIMILTVVFCLFLLHLFGGGGGRGLFGKADFRQSLQDITKIYVCCVVRCGGCRQSTSSPCRTGSNERIHCSNPVWTAALASSDGRLMTAGHWWSCQCAMTSRCSACVVSTGLTVTVCGVLWCPLA